VNKFAAVLLGLLITAVVSALAVTASLRVHNGNEGSLVSQLDLTPLDHLAVQYQGRVKSFGSFADQVVAAIESRGRYQNQDRRFTYLDLMLAPDRYREAPIVGLKKEQMLSELVERLRRARLLSDADAQLALDTQKLSPAILESDVAQITISDWKRNLIKTASTAEQLESAINLMRPEVLAHILRVAPPDDSDGSQQWISLAEILSDSPRADLVSQQHATSISQAFSVLQLAWATDDPDRINPAIDQWVKACRAATPDHYPPDAKLTSEPRYFPLGHINYIWIYYTLPVPSLLLPASLP